MPSARRRRWLICRRSPEPQPQRDVRTVAAHGIAVAFEDVHFTWDPARGPALNGLSFRVPDGETLVLAGPSGAGKSTVIEILLGFVRPDKGRVTINGADIADLVPQALARLTAWIGQRPVLFASTIRDNIRFARPEATDAEVEEAARSASVTEFSAALPDGLDTAVGEGGYGLSGGQAQRVAIARAFLKNAPLLLLDEPTAHLDPATEGEVLDSLRRLALGRTVILASHSSAAHGLAGPAARYPRRACRSGARCGVTDYSTFSASGGVVRLWLAAGIVVSLAALAAGVSMMVLGGVVLGAAVAVGTLAAPVALRVLGSARVVLRYAERLLTHAATFRALADLRVWFFRNLAHGSAGGLGFRQAGDVLARLVGDIEALDGLYLRILVPLAGAVLLFPLLVVLIGMHSVWLALAVGVLFAVAAFALPWLSARAAARAGVALANAAGGLRIATLGGHGGRGGGGGGGKENKRFTSHFFNGTCC